jgi:hypothetical protein
MMVLSCDPGLTGAITLIDSQRGLLECADIPTCDNGTASGSMKRWVDAAGIEALVRGWSAKHEFASHSVHAVIERPIPMPTRPAQTIASQFDTFGTIRSILTCLLPPAAVEYVSPQAWKKIFGLKADKAESIACAVRLYPAAAGQLRLKKSHNRAEAILLGHWWLRTNA